MVEQLLDHLGRRRHHVGADQRAFEHMGDMAHAGDEDFGFKQVIVVNPANVADQVHPVDAIVVVPPDKGRYERRPRLRREQCLVRAEAQGDIDHGAIVGQRLAGLEPVDRQRHLDADIVRNLAQDLSLFHHRCMVERNDFCADRTIGDAADFLRHFHEIPPRFRDQRRVGCDPIEQAGRSQFLDVVDFGSVGEEFHVGVSLQEV